MSRLEVTFSPEVQHALRTHGAVVAMETSVLAQGLPFPRNLESTLACQAAIREAGAVPAAIAVLEGRLCVGLDEAQIRRLAESGRDVWKLGGRDVAVAVARRATGATTVSATCLVAAAVGIRVFATGGIGGVHREVTEHGDVSQDLDALARFPVAVVCAGAKSVLDLPRTLEALETLGVPVVGVGSREFPSFYSRESGLQLEHQVESAAEGAQILHQRFDRFGQGGIVFTLGPPEDVALRRDEVERDVQQALSSARREGISGKAVTPFLLREMSRLSGGKTLAANVALLTHNARFAGELAVEDARVRAAR